MSKLRGRVLASAVAAALAGVIVAPRGMAAESTWNNFSGGNLNWNVASNWLPVGVPASGPDTEIVFGASDAQTYTAVQNVSNPFQLNKLTFTTTSTEMIKVGGTADNAAANTIRFAGTAPVLTHSGTGVVLLNGPLNLAADTTIHVTGDPLNPDLATLIMSGNISQTGGSWGLTKTGSGVMQWGTVAPLGNRGVSNSITGEIKILEGTLFLGNAGGSFISAGSMLTIAAGAVMDIQSNAEDFGSLQGDGRLIGADNINVGQDDRSATWGGVIELTGFVGKQGTGTWTLTGTNTYSGETRVIEGEMIFAGANGSANASSSVTISPGATLTLDNSAANNNDRLNDFAFITLAGNAFVNLMGNGTVDTEELVGALTLNGAGTLTVTPGAGRSARLTSESLARDPGDTVLFRGAGLGAVPGPNVSSIFFTNAPELVGGGGAAGTTSQSIVPYALGDLSPAGLGNTLVTHDPTTGIRPLDLTSEYASYATATDLDNVRIVGSAGGLAGKPINSLVVHNPDVTAIAVEGQAGTTLTPVSGAMLFTGSGPTTLGGFGEIAFGDREGIITVASDSPVTIASPISGNLGVTKNGAGVLVLSGNNTYFTGTTITAGTLQISSAANLGDAGGLITFGIGTLKATANVVIPQAILTNSSATFDATGNTMELVGGMTGAGRLNFAGPGRYLVSSLGNGGAVTIDGAELVASTGFITTRAFVIPAAGSTIDTGEFDVSIGAVSGAGHLTKEGAGVLTVTASSAGMIGEWRVNEGTLRNGLATDGQGDETTVVIAAGATFDDSFGNGELMGGIAGAGTVLLRAGVGYTIGNHDKDDTFSGVMHAATDGAIGGAVTALRKGGTGTWTLAGLNDYEGPTEIRNGAIKLGIDNALPAPNAVTAHPGTRLTLGTPTSALAGIFEMDGFDQTLAGLAVATNNTAGAANLVINSNAANPSTLTVINAADTTYSGVLAGNLSFVKQGSFTQTLGGANTYTGTTTVSEGTLNRTGTHTGGGAYTVAAGATLQSANGIIAPSLTVNGTVTMQPNGTNAGTSDVGALVIAGATDAWTGTLDLANNDMVIRTAGGAARDAAFATAVNQVKSGLNAAGGVFWTGTGIQSSTAAADSGGILTAVGIILNDFAQVPGLPAGPIVTEFSGRTVTENDILAKYTYFGDADLNGVVDATDYSLIDNAFNLALLNGGWLNGDFDFNGVVDATDYSLIDNAFNSQTVALAGGAAASAVPEPAALGVLSGATAGLLLRRRRSALLRR